MTDRGDEESMSRQVTAQEELSALEVTVAAMENRLREQITDLIQPTIQRTTLLASDSDMLKGIVATHTKSLQECQLGQFKVLEQVATIASFREDMSRWDTQRRHNEVSVDEKLESMSQRIDAFKYNLEQKESALHHLHRSIDRATGEVNRLVEEQETQVEFYSQRLDDLSLKINSLRSEVEVQVAGLEMRHNAITDELWGEETGLAKLGGELRKTNFSIDQLEAAVRELHEGKAEAEALDKLRSEVARTVHDTNAAVSGLKNTVGTVVSDVREHFRTASQTISAHNAAFVTEVRKEYEEELAHAAKLRGEVKEFMNNTEQGISVLDSRVAAADRKACALAGEVREEVEELNRRRKRDKASTDNELKTLKKRLGGVFDSSDMVLRGIEHLYSVLDMVLQSETASCSVEMQDSQDRKRIALVGVKDEESALARTTATEPQYPRPEARRPTASAYSGKKAPSGAKAGAPLSARGGGQDPVVRVDNRCLGCSGQSPLVLSAFKMACLQYTPSPVPFGGSLRDRDDVLQERSQLLGKARDLLVEGPLNKGAGGGAMHVSASDKAAIAGLVAADRDPGIMGPLAGGDALSGYASLDATTASMGRTTAASGFRLPDLPSAPYPQAVTA
eukprot:TRINITY_DN17862_c0_g1_i2.p1 TRINITY_DN17862_c0_g1~~TRINITY_DN17862_c0_g1_i2.p1  ORF type:complete len:621 (-),score=149.69 TRINITY_DN17862_c0_g1_i2:495-2357(-)